MIIVIIIIMTIIIICHVSDLFINLNILIEVTGIFLGP